jgi:hypothetical protein
MAKSKSFGPLDMLLPTTADRFAYSDHALYRALSLQDTQDLPIVVSYDSACSYSVNILDRFAVNLPAHHQTISKARFAIDSLHVNDHIEKCMYMFLTSYMEGVGHFHGVGNEQFFSENNQAGPQTRQMNRGYRHDKLTAFFGGTLKRLLNLVRALPKPTSSDHTVNSVPNHMSFRSSDAVKRNNNILEELSKQTAAALRSFDGREPHTGS